MSRHSRVLLGVCGGIAAYKVVDLASRLTTLGHEVRTVMTASACELIRPKSFAAVTGQAVYTNLWAGAEEASIDHVHLVDWADGVVVAPATANLLGKMAHGIADDLLTTLLCVCWQKPRLLAPAMNTRMWSNPVVQENVQTLERLGCRFVGPEAGRLACGDEGPGRLASVESLVAAVQEMAAGRP